MERCFSGDRLIELPYRVEGYFGFFSLQKVGLKHWKDTQGLFLQDWKGLMKYYLNIEKAVQENQDRKKNNLIECGRIYMKQYDYIREEVRLNMRS